MYNNYQKLLNIKYHNYLLELILIFLIIIFIIFILKYSVYEKINLMGIYKDNNIHIKCPIYNSDTIIYADILLIDNKKVKYKILKISDILEEDNVNYQIVEIKTNNKYLENELVQLSFYYKKETIFKKIINIVKEG